MYEQELTNIRLKIQEALKKLGSEPEAAIQDFVNIKAEAENTFPAESPEWYATLASVEEHLGNIAARQKKNAEAEKHYKEMVRLSVKLFDKDNDKFDFRLGTAFHRLAKFYTTLIQCDRMQLKPVVLDGQKEKIFKTCEMIFNDAIRCTLKNGKSGKGMYVEFHSVCMHDMMVFYAAAGKYEEALKHGKNGIQLEKAIYEKMDDKVHSFRLAERMTALAAVYTASNDLQSAMETLEDAIFALEEHEADDPVKFGLMLGRSYISLAGTYDRLPEEAAQAEDTFKKGYAKLEEVQEKSKRIFLDDMISANVVLGEFYKKKERPEAKVYFQEALKLAQAFKEQTKNARYDYLIAKLKVQVR